MTIGTIITRSSLQAEARAEAVLRWCNRATGAARDKDLAEISELLARPHLLEPDTVERLEHARRAAKERQQREATGNA